MLVVATTERLGDSSVLCLPANHATGARARAKPNAVKDFSAGHQRVEAKNRGLELGCVKVTK